MKNTAEKILNYLKTQLPSYPFNAKIDPIFVAELIEDFQELDLLEQTKAFRWYYDNEPASKLKNLRVALRRWFANANARRQAYQLRGTPPKLPRNPNS